jgi:hypothetical protein
VQANASYEFLSRFLHEKELLIRKPIPFNLLQKPILLPNHEINALKEFLGYMNMFWSTPLMKFNKIFHARFGSVKKQKIILDS